MPRWRHSGNLDRDNIDPADQLPLIQCAVHGQVIVDHVIREGALLIERRKRDAAEIPLFGGNLLHRRAPGPDQVLPHVDNIDAHVRLLPQRCTCRDRNIWLTDDNQSFR
jgi:hypothetical protein